MTSLEHLRTQIARAGKDPGLVASRLRALSHDATSARFAFLETNHDSKNTLLLISSQRSGSTWLAEALVGDSRTCRYLFEIFDSRTGREFSDLPGTYVEPDTDDPRIDALMTAALTGRVRSRWTDQYNTARFPDHRLIKEVLATNLAPRISTRFPEVPIIYLIRHPLACASSWLRLGWSTLGTYGRQQHLMEKYFPQQHSDILRQDFLTNVYRWCVENSGPVHTLAAGSTHVVFYEHLVLHPDRELERIQSFLRGRSQGRWRTWSPDLASTDRPSSSVFRTNGAGPTTRTERSGWWANEIPEAWIDPAMRIVRMFDLGWVYGEEPAPLIEGSQLLSHRVP
jgi:hypothetical protein